MRPVPRQPHRHKLCLLISTHQGCRSMLRHTLVACYFCLHGKALILVLSGWLLALQTSSRSSPALSELEASLSENRCKVKLLSVCTNVDFD
ncbi:hypothetical protein BDV93DRAFT_368457 [Ceratobasidium sp. AG-I]|nr:hypothetical protein BDV93DRAFT_368457 [Ceratobasidium sp. AG-I]